MNTQRYTVNVRVGGIGSPRVAVSQGDIGRRLVFNLFDGAVAFAMTSGTTVTIVGRKPSGLGFDETCTHDGGNSVSVRTTEAMTQEAGKIPAELRISDGTKVIGTANFVFYVEPSPHPNGTTDGTLETMDDIQTQIGDLSDLTTSDKSSLVGAINEAAQSGGTEVVIDDTLTQSGQAADAKKTGDKISAIKADLGDLSSEVDIIYEDSYTSNSVSISTTATAWRLMDTGLCISSTDYKMVKYAVTPGDKLKVVSDDKFQFQTVASVPSTGVPNRIGKTYGAGTYYLIVPDGATYLIVSTTISNSTATVSSIRGKIGELGAITDNGDIEWVDGYGVNYETGVIANQYRSYTEVDVGIFAGGRLTGHTSDADNWGGAFYDVDGIFISGFKNPVTGAYSFDINVEIPSNAVMVKISCRTDYKSEFWLSYPFDRYTPNIQALWSDMATAKNDINNIDKKSEVKIPLLRNGSIGNGLNANAVTSYYILPIYKKYDRIYVEFVGDFSLANQYGLAYCLFRGASDGDTTSAAFASASVTKKQVNNNFDAPLYPSPRILIEMTDISDYDHISVCMFRKLNGTYVPIRIATDQYSIKVSYEYNPDIPVRDIDTDNVSHISDNARHIKGNSGTPLTLLHFSDIHADTSALARIMKDAESYTLDDKICTGDMVVNSYGQITSWWDASVMTCIGNHDSASYDASTGYNWTALSMANRDAYYITPFKTNWGVTHTTGKSYYYKDYSTQKVRLIVMDGMLYSDNGADATAQTAWLADLLASAITNNLHVIIAIHAPHGGAVPVECSFSRYGQDTMPTHSDCNTPQVVIDTVATAIGNGLHFIGYLVGHTHQDNIWDAENNKKQLMYGVTCAHVSNVNQWKNSDQNRSVTEDAYNIVTIDTTNNLIKIVRGGGADIDDHMRTRKAICIDYSTGNVVGEVL